MISGRRDTDRDDIAALAAAADLALELGVPIIDGVTGIAVIPDVVLLELESSGQTIPPAPSMHRGGRSCRLYRWPDWHDRDAK